MSRTEKETNNHHSLNFSDNVASQDGRSPWARAEAQGISANGENIAAGDIFPTWLLHLSIMPWGNPSAQATLDQWKGSDGHCNNMMNPSAKLVGVARAENSDSSYRYYWTQMFAAEGQKPAVVSCLSSGKLLQLHNIKTVAFHEAQVTFCCQRLIEKILEM